MHREEVKKYQKEYGFEKIVGFPEAHGVSIQGLLAKYRIKPEWFRKNNDGSYNLPKITRRVSLAGYST